MAQDFQVTQPAALHQLSGNAADEFAVRHPTELQGLLHQLVDHNVLVSLSSRGGATYTTTLWTVDAHQRRLSFSADASHPAVGALINAGAATAVAYLDSVKLQFDIEHLVLVHGSGSSAIQAALPNQLYRFQRRDSFRVRTPAASAPSASLADPVFADRALRLRVLDVSAGGCALALPADVAPPDAGVRLAGVRIELDADTRFDATLSLQHVSSGMAGSGLDQRLGCAFVDLDGAARRTLQRYIDQTQQRQRRFSIGGPARALP